MLGSRPRIRQRGARVGQRGACVWRRGPIALLSALVVVLLALSQGAEALHFYLVPHRMCALHGLEHTVHEEAQAPTSSASRTIAAPATIAAATQSLEGSHERCGVLQSTDKRQAVLGPSTWSPPVAEARHPIRTPLPARDETRRPTASLLLLAPKHGPPA